MSSLCLGTGRRLSLHFEDSQCLPDVSRHIELGRKGDVVDLRLRPFCRVGPKLECVRNPLHVPSAFDNRGVSSVLNNLGKPVRARSDDRLAGREGFQA